MNPSLYSRINRTPVFLCISLLTVFHCLLIESALAKKDVTLSAALSSTEIYLDSAVKLTITVGGVRSADVEIPEIMGLNIFPRGQSSHIQSVNGKFSSSIALNYLIQPVKEGKYLIPPITVNAEGTTLLTKEMKLQVINRNTAPSEPNNQKQGKSTPEEIAFLTVEIDRDSVYSGEVVPVTVKAYFLKGLRAELLELPKITGDAFIQSPLDNQPEQTVESLNKRHYSVLTWHSTVTAIKNGVHNLSMGLQAVVFLPERSNRQRQRRSPFFDDDFFTDDFFTGFFESYQRKNITLSNSNKQIDILPLPEENRPDAFNGAIGNFEFHVSAKPLKIHAGDPVTVTMNVSGKGNFDRIAAPHFPETVDWKTYSPTTEFKPGKNNHHGEKVFEQAVVITNDHVDTIPSIPFCYFDPEREEYILKKSSPIPLEILSIADKQTTAKDLPRNEMQKSSAPSSDADPEVTTVRLTAGKHIGTISPVYTRNWFITTAAISTVILFISIGYHTITKYRRRNSALIDQKEKKKQIICQLRQLSEYAEHNDQHNFFILCRQIIQNHISLVYNTTASTITFADAKKLLPAESSCISLFRISDEFSYGGSNRSQDEIRNYLILLQKELEEILK